MLLRCHWASRLRRGFIFQAIFASYLWVGPSATFAWMGNMYASSGSRATLEIPSLLPQLLTAQCEHMLHFCAFSEQVLSFARFICKVATFTWKSSLTEISVDAVENLYSQHGIVSFFSNWSRVMFQGNIVIPFLCTAKHFLKWVRRNRKGSHME